ncbi:unnamed protein product, partial [Candidula unifasciata]
MALVTIQRSPSPSLEQDLDATDSTDDGTHGSSQMRKSLSQSYFTVKGAALILPHNEFTKKSARKNHGGEIQHHLQAMLHLLRPEDTIKIAVRLEDINQYKRYMALVSTKGRQDTEEAVILGIDCTASQASIGLVLPVWMGLRITLGGDGGFSVRTDEQCYLFKPVSVQAMWSAIQSLVKVQHIADDMKYIRDGLTHTWVGYYKSRIDRRDPARVGQWNIEGVEVFAPSSLSIQSSDGDERIKLAISHTLKEVMMTVDLDEATSLMLRKAVEEKMNLSLSGFKGYFDEEVMRIVGQMDEPSEILDFLFLGSEWNASNLEELQEKGIDYILNITKEIDNFFEGRFHYYNVRVYDEDSSDLLKHWDKTYKFISKARSQNSKVLVHCKMGVSRSASTVMAFLMKERRWTVEEAFKFVKERRSCVHPNAGFMEQLQMYQGILTASNKRDIFRSKSDQNLLDENAKDDLEPPDMSFLGEDLFHMMSHSDWLSASGGVAHGEEWIGSLYQDELHDTDMLQVGTDLETECRTADSMEEVLPDLPSPPPETASRECLSLSLPTTRASFERSSCDTELTQETEVDSETHSGCSTYCQQTSGGSPTSKIKPDSSWIRLDIVDTEEETGSILNSKLIFSKPVPCSDSVSSTDYYIDALDSSAKDLHVPDTVDSQETVVTEPHRAATQPQRAAATDSHEAAISEPPVAATELRKAVTEPLFGTKEPHAAATEPLTATFYMAASETPIAGTKTHAAATNAEWEMPDVHKAIRECDLKAPNLQEASTDTHGTLVSHSEPSLLTVNSRELSQVASTAASDPSPQPTISGLDVSLTGEINTKTESSIGQTSLSSAATILPGFVDSSSVFQGQKCSSTFGSSMVTTSSQPPTNKHEVMIISSGTSPHIRSDLGVQQIFFQENIPWTPGKVLFYFLFSEIHISAHPQVTVVRHSYSCMELCIQEDDNLAVGSVYEREKIPLTPGLVLRTKQEIEGRQCGDSEQEPHPMLRTSSLKHHRDSPHSKSTHTRQSSGPVLSLQEDKCVGKAQSIRIGEIQQTDMEILATSQLDHLKDMPDNYVCRTQPDAATSECRTQPDAAMAQCARHNLIQPWQ